MNIASPSIQERLQIKREPLDKWSLREQLCLASAVTRSGDQNWISVSRSLKPFGETNRPPDWFHQKDCVAQYGALLANVDIPKRKKRDSAAETPAECILKQLICDRQAELRKLLAEEKAEYKKLQEDMKVLQSGRVTEEQLDKWCKEIDDEEAKRELEAQNHAKWLKQRDLRKQEMERAWRSGMASIPNMGQKRKTPDLVEEFIEDERESNCQTPPAQIQNRESLPAYQQQQYVSSPLLQSPSKTLLQFPNGQLQETSENTTKPGLAPLLTSLLKSPSQVHNPVSTSILHSAITNHANKLTEVSNTTSSPTITSLLNSTAPITSNIPQLISCEGEDQPLNADILDDASIKIDDLAKSILVEDGPFPEIKKEEVDDIISEIIENNHDLVSDPEQHLELDGNGDIKISLELDDLEQEQEEVEALKNKGSVKEETTEKVKNDKVEENSVPAEAPAVVDPFEFQEDPVLFESPVKPSSLKQESGQYVPLYQQQSPSKNEETEEKTSVISEKEKSESPGKSLIAPAQPQMPTHHGSVEIVEVHAEEPEGEKEFNKSQIRDIVHSTQEEESKTNSIEEPPLTKLEDEVKEVAPVEPETKEPELTEEENNAEADISIPQTSEFNDDLYDIAMEVKIDKTGKAKRDYSRLKKKEEKSFDMLLAIEKAQFDSMSDDMGDFKELDKKQRLKSENDRSNSPWTEDEQLKPVKRRYSTPSTPVDSLPNSPASNTSAFDDDKDYRNWKKSVMLVYNRLSSNKYASLFLKPITEEQAPGYSSTVYRPMDLQTIKKNIDSGVIRTSLEFKRDVMLMFTNAVMYNKTLDTVYNMALQMQQEAMESIEILLEAAGSVDAPSRRETRTSDLNCKRKRITDEPANKAKKKRED
ncbi:bromodomain-containing protein 8 [Euwallacea fornicatus]|uniref:bromodomain-containing protein 8 n=1 Tax=Euwallacea fornicatus TaxID=995702 RepID=UPI0033905717